MVLLVVVWIVDVFSWQMWWLAVVVMVVKNVVVAFGRVLELA